MKNKNIVFYIIISCLFIFLIYFVFKEGKHLENYNQSATYKLNTLPEKINRPDNVQATRELTEQDLIKNFKESVKNNLNSSLSILILQIVVIILVSRLFGFIFTKIGQPSVTGEIIAGIVLGPSLVGMLYPDFSTFIFPKDSLKNLQLISQIGLILFMFIIGMELNIKVLKNKMTNALVISHASILIPYLLGVCLAYFIYENYATANVTFLAFGLFIGISMSITAFPVLARIIKERKLTNTQLGTMALTCAAIDDVTAWCILAAVIAIIKAGSFINSLSVIIMSIFYLAFMLKLVQPYLKKFEQRYESFEDLDKTTLSILFLILLGSAYLTEIIGIHALFGAFLAGTIMPDKLNSRKVLIEKIEDVSLILLLPLFFVFTGLRTEIGLLNTPEDIFVCMIIISVAVMGKFGGGTIASKFVGLSWKDSLSIGALMNTRGLMELIVLNIGYDLGILGPKIFAMMVVMAIVTTLMTGPALDLINLLFKKKKYQSIP